MSAKPAKKATPPARGTAAGVVATVARKPSPRAAPVPGATPNAILESALAAFARDGFDGASIPAIARAASIGHPLVHYHFGSKENLWRAAVDYAFGDLRRSMEVLEQAAVGLKPIDALLMICRGFAQFTARHPLHTLIILNEVRSGGERLEWLVESHLAPLHAGLDRAIDAAVAAGQLRPIPAAHLASIMVGSIVHFFGAADLNSRLYRLNVRDPAVIEAHTNWVLDILLHGLAPVAAPGASS